MDRLDEWAIFVAVAGRRSFVAAARALGRSPQAVTRAVAAIEARLGARLLLRTTRSVSLTSDGERLLERGRRALAEWDELETPAERSAPLRGRVSVTASVLLGQLHVAPIVAEFLRRHPGVEVRLLLLDRVVSLAEEGVDLAVRVGALPDSSLRAQSVGAVRAVLCASPGYLRRAGAPRTPDALARHPLIAFSGTTPLADRWSFPDPQGRRRERTVAVRPRLVVNTAQAAIDAAVAGLGIARVLSYQVASLVAAGRLELLLTAHEPAPMPVHVLQLPGAKGRAAMALVELTAERLRERLAAGRRPPGSGRAKIRGT